MRILIRAAMVAGTVAAVLAPVAAQAAPRVTTAKLGTYGPGRAGVVAEAGLAAGMWTRALVRGGAAGEDLIVTLTPRSRPLTTERTVYTAAFDEVADARAECAQVGADGIARKAWMSFRCRTGFAPSYTLLVR